MKKLLKIMIFEHRDSLLGGAFPIFGGEHSPRQRHTARGFSGEQITVSDDQRCAVNQWNIQSFFGFQIIFGQHFSKMTCFE